MSAPLVGCIADDYTGATDLASMLVRAGLRVIQCFGTPTSTQSFDDADAIVVSLKSRSIPADDAVEMSLEALRFLQKLGCERFFFKYCSTFDSTPRGNIGPVADALAEALEEAEVLFCPSFPENGRTVYCGCLFVAGVPLHESGMRNHPLNPMTDSNLVRVLQAQSSRSVWLLGLGEALPRNFDGHVIADAITNDDLERIAKLSREHRLLTGGSAIARYWAEELMDGAATSKLASGSQPTLIGGSQPKHVGDPRSAKQVILAGSCSDATRAQIAEFEIRYPTLRLPLDSDDAQHAADEALAWCDEQWNVLNSALDPLLICSSADSVAVATARNCWGEHRAAELVEQIFGLIARGLVERGVHQFVVAGGETSGSVINALDIKAVHIGAEIAPGVPWVHSNTSPQLSLALKSGNFGGPRFFLDALECAL